MIILPKREIAFHTVYACTYRVNDTHCPRLPFRVENGVEDKRGV
jgi:hypothetical protein